jgi:AAA family ATP:ADP antiporter
MSAIAPTSPPPPGPLDRFLHLFTDVRDGEGRSLCCSRSSCITHRLLRGEAGAGALILDQPGGADSELRYAAQAVLLVVLVPLYGALATRLPRRRLINVVTAFCIACLPAFYLLAEAKAPVGLVFFLWIGVFSLIGIAQFWAYANDIYTPEAGKRLFAVIAFGASSGAVFGAWISSHLIRAIGVNPLLLAAATVLAVSLILFNFIDLRGQAAQHRRTGPAREDVPIGAGNAFALVLRNRYLVLMALVILFLNWVNTSGEYILSSIVKHAADAEVAAGTFRRAKDVVHRRVLLASQSSTSPACSSCSSFRGGKVSRRPGSALHRSARRPRELRYGGAHPFAGDHPVGENGRELDRLLAHEHGSPDAVPADDARGEVQGEAGDRQLRRSDG